MKITFSGHVYFFCNAIINCALYFLKLFLISFLVVLIEEILSGVPTDSPPCPICGSYFFNRSSLKRHLERHLLANRKRFQCDVCFKYFCRKDYVREHKQHKHGLCFRESDVNADWNSLLQNVYFCLCRIVFMRDTWKVRELKKKNLIFFFNSYARNNSKKFQIKKNYL